MSLASLSRLRLNLLAPVLSRAIQTSKSELRPIPPTRESITSPSEFLTAIGRSAETKVNVETWDDLWKTDGPKLRTEHSVASPKDRRYILWCMEKYRQGLPIKDFAHEPKPKKTIRGWGPVVQNGKRIRSKRLPKNHKRRVKRSQFE